MSSHSGPVVGLTAVIVAVTEEVPRILTVGPDAVQGEGRPSASDSLEALPDGLLDPAGDPTLELALRRQVREQSGLELGYVEQLYTFGDLHRVPRRSGRGGRLISVAYLALVEEGRPSRAANARWRDWYAFFPWEDWRQGRPPLIERVVEPELERWIASAPGRRARLERQERAAVTFGLGGATWDAVRVLERYELLYEMGLVTEAARDRAVLRGGEDFSPGSDSPSLGTPLTVDHRRILASALGRLRGKLSYRPLVFELLAPTFTLFQLQKLVEALLGIQLHKQNFRRLVEQGGLVEETGDLKSQTGGRPAKLFRFRREVLRERRAPGVAIPTIRGVED